MDNQKIYYNFAAPIEKMMAMKESKVILGLFLAAVLWAGCASNAKKAGMAEDADTLKDTTIIVTDTATQQTAYHLDFDVKKLVMALDTSTRPNLGFVNQADARSFIENTLKTEPFDYEGMTYFIHPVERDGDQYLYIDTPYGDDKYETRYVIYPPRQENGFWRIEIEYYV